jgi:hypothetical protein
MARILTDLLFGMALVASGPGVGQEPNLRASAMIVAQLQSNQQKLDETLKSAQRFEMFGYIAAAVGLVMVIASIPVSYYLARKKRARKRAAQQRKRGDPRSP